MAMGAQDRQGVDLAEKFPGDAPDAGFGGKQSVWIHLQCVHQEQFLRSSGAQDALRISACGHTFQVEIG